MDNISKGISALEVGLIIKSEGLTFAALKRAQTSSTAITSLSSVNAGGLRNIATYIQGHRGCGYENIACSKIRYVALWRLPDSLVNGSGGNAH